MMGNSRMRLGCLLLRSCEWGGLWPHAVPQIGVPCKGVISRLVTLSLAKID